MMRLPSGWSIATIDDLVADKSAITDGPFGSNLKTSHYTDAGPRVIRLQNIGDGVFNDERAHISEQHYDQLRKHAVQEGDLIIASLGTELPRSCLVPRGLGPAIVKADCIRVRLDRSVADGRYVNYLLNSPHVRHQATDIVHGVGRPRLGLKGIRQLKLPVAPLDEQRRIVDAIEEQLSRLDNADMSLREASSLLVRLRKTVLVQVVPSTLPSTWTWSTVRDVGVVNLGRQRSPKYHSGPDMRPYLRVANVFEDRIDTTDIMEMDFPPEQFEKYRLREGDILLNEGQSPELVGRPAMYKGDPPDVAFTNSLIRFRPHEHVDRDFALLVFLSHLHSGRFQQEAQITTNIAHMAAGRFMTVEFPVPPLDDQRRIVSEIDRQLTIVREMLVSTKDLSVIH
jgi:type I restriction enzyme S subunit